MFLATGWTDELVEEEEFATLCLIQGNSVVMVPYLASISSLAGTDLNRRWKTPNKFLRSPNK